MCVAIAPLPRYPIESIRTGELADGSDSWHVDINPDINLYKSLAAAATAGDFGDPIADSDFDIYLDDGADDGGRRLIYIKQPCDYEDAQPKFFLHIIPTDVRDLPDARQEHGFEKFDFNYNGGEIKVSGGRCVALVGLSGYPIERIRTGQYTGAGSVWRAEIELGE